MVQLVDSIALEFRYRAASVNASTNNTAVSHNMCHITGNSQSR